MPRYEDKKRGWWLEIQGAPDMPQSALFDLYAALTVSGPVMARLIKGHNLTDWDGVPVDFAPPQPPPPPPVEGAEAPVPPPAKVSNISRRQLKFVRDSIIAAVNDEELDPEA